MKNNPLPLPPKSCLVFVPEREPGKQIVRIVRGESGCFPTTYDETDAEKAKELVKHLNANKGVSEEQAKAMLIGSMFGWNTPGAACNVTKIATPVRIDEGSCGNRLLVSPNDELILSSTDVTPSELEQIASALNGKAEATLFMQELLWSVETLAGIADEHGARTLADLMYLQDAILNGGFIDHYPDESSVLEVASALPSGERWHKFIKKVGYLMAQA